MTRLFQELGEQGYQGSYESVRDNILRRLPQGRKMPLDASSQTPALATSREASFLFLRRSDKLKTEERETLLLLRQLHPETNLAYELVQQFARMLRTRTGEKLDDWLAQVSDSHIQELRSFALGIERDKLAVVAGLTLPQNNGLGDRKSQQVETHQAYGLWQSWFSFTTPARPPCPLATSVSREASSLLGAAVARSATAGWLRRLVIPARSA